MTTASRFPIVLQFAMNGTGQQLTGLPAGIIGADVTCDQAWSFGDTAACLFNVAANVIKTIPVAKIGDGYFNAASGTLTVACYVSG